MLDGEAMVEEIPRNKTSWATLRLLELELRMREFWDDPR